MELWIVLLLYIGGLFLVGLEILLPGMVIGFIGSAMVITATYHGFQNHWSLGGAQILFALIVIPFAFLYGSKRMALKTTLSSDKGAISFRKDYDAYLGKEGESLTDLKPGGMIRLDGKKVDVVTGGEMISKGTKVRVVKVEGNRVFVRET